MSRPHALRVRYASVTRTLRLALLAFLLLFMQGQALVHPISHLPAPATHDDGFVASHAAADCVECALLAGGFTALHASLAPAVGEAPPTHLVFFSHRSRAGEVPVWFESRAPPVLL